MRTHEFAGQRWLIGSPAGADREPDFCGLVLGSGLLDEPAQLQGIHQATIDRVLNSVLAERDPAQISARLFLRPTFTSLDFSGPAADDVMIETLSELSSQGLELSAFGREEAVRKLFVPFAPELRMDIYCRYGALGLGRLQLVTAGLIGANADHVRQFQTQAFIDSDKIFYCSSDALFERIADEIRDRGLFQSAANEASKSTAMSKLDLRHQGSRLGEASTLKKSTNDVKGASATFSITVPKTIEGYIGSTILLSRVKTRLTQFEYLTSAVPDFSYSDRSDQRLVGFSLTTAESELGHALTLVNEILVDLGEGGPTTTEIEEAATQMSMQGPDTLYLLTMVAQFSAVVNLFESPALLMDRFRSVTPDAIKKIMVASLGTLLVSTASQESLASLPYPQLDLPKVRPRGKKYYNRLVSRIDNSAPRPTYFNSYGVIQTDGKTLTVMFSRPGRYRDPHQAPIKMLANEVQFIYEDGPNRVLVVDRWGQWFDFDRRCFKKQQELLDTIHTNMDPQGSVVVTAEAKGETPGFEKSVTKSRRFKTVSLVGIVVFGLLFSGALLIGKKQNDSTVASKIGQQNLAISIGSGISATVTNYASSVYPGQPDQKVSSAQLKVCREAESKKAKVVSPSDLVRLKSRFSLVLADSTQGTRSTYAFGPDGNPLPELNTAALNYGECASGWVSFYYPPAGTPNQLRFVNDDLRVDWNWPQ